ARQLSQFFALPAPATSEIYPLSLHDALPISISASRSLAMVASALSTSAVSCVGGLPSASSSRWIASRHRSDGTGAVTAGSDQSRSEEHTSELQSPYDLVCRLLLEKKKKV